MNKTVLITGASSGIGAGCRNSRHADQPGHRNNRIKEITQVRLYVDKDKRYGHLAFEYIRNAYSLSSRHLKFSPIKKGSTKSPN